MPQIPAYPAILERPFAADGDKASIPDVNAASGRATLADGFPIVTQQPLNAGGVPPSRLDFNGILNLLSQFAMWQQSGGLANWNATLNYTLPALVVHGGTLYLALASSGPGVSGVGAKTPGAAGSEEYWLDYATSITPPAVEKYDLGEFYYFRHPTLKPGFQPALGGLLQNAATLYPEVWAYLLQTVEGQKLCTTEAQWQAMTTATWATLADGTKVGWNGIGGAPYYAPNTATGALRLPDLRGMYAEAAGFDALGVGGVHGDGGRNITGVAHIGAQAGAIYPLTLDSHSVGGDANQGAFTHAVGPGYASTGVNAAAQSYYSGLIINSSRVVPVAAKNQPRAWGALACCYLGSPAS